MLCFRGVDLQRFESRNRATSASKKHVQQQLTVAPLFQDGRCALRSAPEGSTFSGAAPPPRSAPKGKPSVRCSGTAWDPRMIEVNER